MEHDEPTYKSMWPEAECPSCAAKDARIAALEEEVVELNQIIEDMGYEVAEAYDRGAAGSDS